MVDGLPGDIVALALPLDIMKIQEAGLIRDGWQVGLPCGLPASAGDRMGRQLILQRCCSHPLYNDTGVRRSFVRQLCLLQRCGG